MQELDRGDAVLGAALLELARLLVGVDVADQPVVVGVGGDRLEPGRRDGADAVGGDADGDARAAVRPRAQRVDAREERPDVRVAEAALARASAAAPKPARW